MYLRFAARAGRLLLLAKQRVPHGEWKDWIKANCQFAVRTAQDYMRCARAVKKGLIDPQHAASLRSALSTLRELNGSGEGRTDPQHAAGRGRNTPSALPKKIGLGKREPAPEGDADLADPIPDLMVWDDSRQRFVSLTIRLGDVALADADPASRAHFRRSVKETIDVLSKYSDCPENERE